LVALALVGQPLHFATSAASPGEKLHGPEVSEFSPALIGDKDPMAVDMHRGRDHHRQEEAHQERTSRTSSVVYDRLPNVLDRPIVKESAALWAANIPRKGQKVTSYEEHLQNFIDQLIELFAANTAGEGRGLQAARRISERIHHRERRKGAFQLMQESLVKWLVCPDCRQVALHDVRDWAREDAMRIVLANLLTPDGGAEGEGLSYARAP
jgi:hypothetical protein